MAKSVYFKTDHTVAQIAYLAGLIDAKACFYIYCTHNSKYGLGYIWHSIIKITSIKEELIIWLEQNFDGCTHKCKISGFNDWKPISYHWQATGSLIDYILPVIHPYLIIKIKQCEIMMEYRATITNCGRKRLPDDINDKRILLMQELNKLNSHSNEFITAHINVKK